MLHALCRSYLLRILFRHLCLLLLRPRYLSSVHGLLSTVCPSLQVRQALSRRDQHSQRLKDRNIEMVRIDIKGVTQ